jgi:ArsR family transcriptional regulator
MMTEERAVSSAPNPTTSGCCTPVVPPVRHGNLATHVQLLTALADPTRLQIVELLACQEEPLCVCDIQGHFTLGQPTISHHLRVLREAQLVTWEKRGLWVHYALNRPVLAQVTEHLGGLLAQDALAGARSR